MTTGEAAGDEILREVERLARDKLGWRGALEREMRLVQDLELDSIANLTLAIEIENYFRIRLEEDDERGIETVGDLVAVIARKTQPPPG